MRIHIHEAEDKDFYRLFEIFSDAFVRDPLLFVDAVWPEHWTVEGRTRESNRWLKTKPLKPDSKYLKAVNDAGSIVGMAKWTFKRGEAAKAGETKDPDEEADKGWYPTSEAKRRAEKLLSIYVQERTAEAKRTNGELAVLDYLCVDPAFQRQKVGSKLMEWGVKKADELGLEAVVESTSCGKGLYAKHGFVWQKDVQWVADGIDHGTYAWMIRPKKA
jgi:ribosomal protein S18 acetylase RimI-like enzyme